MRTKTTNLTAIAFVVLSVITLSARAQDDVTNRLSFSARFGMNMSARFKTLRTPVLQSQRITPDGHNYNYDNGYVLRDVSGNAGGKTWYWGYDDSAAQVSGNNVLLNRKVATVPGSTIDDDPSYGGEILYSRMLGHLGHRFSYGFEVAGNYQNMSMSDSSTHAASLAATTDAYPFTPGTTPPVATPSAPYQGSFAGPGFVVGDKPVSSSSTPLPGGATSTSHREFDANLWGWRLGPYLEYPVGENVKLSLSGGFAGAVIDADVSWSEQIVSSSVAAPSVRGGGSDTDVLLGYYVAGNIAVELDARWSILGSVQFQSLENYTHSFGGRSVEARLDEAWFFTIGLGFKF